MRPPPAPATVVDNRPGMLIIRGTLKDEGKDKERTRTGEGVGGRSEGKEWGKDGNRQGKDGGKDGWRSGRCTLVYTRHHHHTPRNTP